MKLFKRIYYPVMAGLMVLMLVLGFVDAHVGVSGKVDGLLLDSAYSYADGIAKVGTHNSYAGQNQDSVRGYITDELTAKYGDGYLSNLVSNAADDTDDDGNNVAEYFTDYSGNPVATLYVQRATVKQVSQKGGDSEVVVGLEANNVVLAIPGKKADAVLMHVRYDSSALGGASDATAVGALLSTAVQELKNFSDGKTHQNTLLFLFSDAGQEGDLGAAAFINQFAGFFVGDTKIVGVENIMAVADYKVSGTSGTIMTYANNGGSLNLMGKYSRIKIGRAHV